MEAGQEQVTPPAQSPVKEETIDDLRQRAIAEFLPDRLKGKETDHGLQKEGEGKEENPLEEKQGTPEAEPKETTAKPPVPTTPEPPKPNLAAKLATIAKKEKELREAQAKFKSTEERLAQLESIISNAKTNPKALLELAKISEEDYANYLLRSPEEEAPEKAMVSRLGDEVKTIKERLEKAEAEKQSLQIQQAEMSFRSDLKTFAEANKEKYPTVHVERGGTDLAFEIVKAYYAETGDIPRTESGEIDRDLVFEKAEEHLKAQALERAKAYQSLPYLKEIFAPKEEPKQKAPVSQAGRETRTLTNTPPVSTPRPDKGNGRMSERERLQWAASLIKDI